eukprot:431919-Prorocentrum_lima.AAC.1
MCIRDSLSGAFDLAGHNKVVQGALMVANLAEPCAISRDEAHLSCLVVEFIVIDDRAVKEASRTVRRNLP